MKEKEDKEKANTMEEEEEEEEDKEKEKKEDGVAEGSTGGRRHEGHAFEMTSSMEGKDLASLKRELAAIEAEGRRREAYLSALN